MRLRPALALALTLATAARAEAPVDGAAEAAPLRPWSYLAENAAGSFQGVNLLLQLGAVSATWALTSQGVDQSVHTTFRDHPAWGYAGLPAVFLDAVGPVILIGGLWGAGRRSQDAELTTASYAVLQSSALTLAWVTVLKTATGRPPPNPDDPRDRSGTFRFGLMRGGIFWGWPSGHTAMAASGVDARRLLPGGHLAQDRRRGLGGLHRLQRERRRAGQHALVLRRGRGRAHGVGRGLDRGRAVPGGALAPRRRTGRALAAPAGRGGGRAHAQPGSRVLSAPPLDVRPRDGGSHPKPPPPGRANGANL